MTRSLTLPFALLAFAGLLSTGCVSQGSHDDLLSINRTLEERVSSLETENEGLRATIRELNAAIRGYQDQASVITALEAQNAELRDLLAQRDAAITDLQSQIAQLASGTNEIVVIEGLPQEVSDALRDLAAANPDLMTYDEARGMIRLRSDLTFGLGSAEVNDAAGGALARLATVLNSAAAREFDIQVVGHTDAVPVTSAAGRQLHIDNRGLSSNRGDAVARVLITNGVTASRVMSGGRGATDPVAANDDRGRSAANRRVEIFLVRASNSGGGDAGAVAPAPQPQGGGEATVGEPAPADDSIFK